MKNETNCGFTFPNFLLLLSLSLCAGLVLPKFLENEGGFVSFCLSCSSLCVIIIQGSVRYSLSSLVQLALEEDDSYSLLA